MKKKYEFTGETKEYFDVTLKRIVAIKDFGDVKKGDLGGWVEHEVNLSHEGDCWIYDEAKVFGEAGVFENAQISDKAMIYGQAKVDGKSKVSGEAYVFDCAHIFDKAVVRGDSRVFENSRVFGYANIEGNARVFGNTSVFGKAFISGCALIFEYAEVYGKVYIFHHAVLRGCAKAHGIGEVITKEAITINHPLHHVTITDTHITIGCQSHPKELWADITYDEVLEVDGVTSAEAWVEFKPFILKLAGL